MSREKLKSDSEAEIVENTNEPGTAANNKQNEMQTATTSIWSSICHFLIILSVFLVIFAAFRNTLTWHLQRFWGASGDFWQSCWNKFLDYAGEDEFTLFVIYTTFYTVTIYWIFGGIFTFFDLTLKPEALRKYKIQPLTNEPVDRKRLMQVIMQVLFNQTVVGFPFAYISYQLMKLRGISEIRELPTFHSVLFELAVFLLVEEIGFYYSHRFLHSKFIYKYVHKQHHEWTSPIAVTALYANPIEHVFSNIFPPFLGVFIMGSHITTSWLWFTLAILNTLNSHSGYHLPFLPSPEAHDFHHLKFNQCFGVLGVLDRLHSTDTLFRSLPAYQRNIMLLNLTPARELFPEKPKKSS